MTGFGQIAWQTFRQAVSESLRRWKEATDDAPGGRRLPAGYLFQKGGAYSGAALLMNRIYTDAIGIEAAKFIPVRRADEKLLERDLLMAKKADWPIAPAVETDGTTHSIQGVDVTESHAFFVESFFRATAQGAPHLSRYYETARKTLRPRYCVCHDYFHDHVKPLEGVREARGIAQRRERGDEKLNKY